MNEDIEQFKRDLNSYNYHLEKMKEIGLQLEGVDYKLSGLRAIPLDRVSPTVSPEQKSLMDLYKVKDDMVRKYNAHKEFVDNVNRRLTILCIWERNILSDKYINGTSNKELEKKYSLSERSINRQCNKLIKRIL